MLKNRVSLQFTKISEKLGSIQNAIKDYLLVFSNIVEAKNIFISVTQGSMPQNQTIHGDWRIYFAILFQVV